MKGKVKPARRKNAGWPPWLAKRLDADGRIRSGPNEKAADTLAAYIRRRKSPGPEHWSHLRCLAATTRACRMTMGETEDAVLAPLSEGRAYFGSNERCFPFLKLVDEAEEKEVDSKGRSLASLIWFVSRLEGYMMARYKDGPRHIWIFPTVGLAFVVDGFPPDTGKWLLAEELNWEEPDDPA